MIGLVIIIIPLINKDKKYLSNPKLSSWYFILDNFIFTLNCASHAFHDLQ